MDENSALVIDGICEYNILNYIILFTIIFISEL